MAAAPCNARRWAPPAVVFHFTRGATPEVEAELRRIGVTVTGPIWLALSVVPLCEKNRFQRCRLACSQAGCASCWRAIQLCVGLMTGARQLLNSWPHLPAGRHPPHRG